jgi:gliding motility-associated-like protein
MVRILLLCVSFILTINALLSQTYTQTSIPINFEAPANDITTTSDDDVFFARNFGFTFNFFCNNFTSANVSTNGLLSFDGITDFANTCLPDASTTNNLVAAYWDDLYFDFSCTPSFFRDQTFGTAPNRYYVVSWVAFTRVDGACGEYIYTQIKLYETSNIIEVHVQTNSLFTNNSGTIGIENATGTIGYQAVCNSNPGDGVAFRWTPSNPPAPAQVGWTTVNGTSFSTPTCGNYSTDLCVGSGVGAPASFVQGVNYTVENQGTAACGTAMTTAYLQAWSPGGTTACGMDPIGSPGVNTISFDAPSTGTHQINVSSNTACATPNTCGGGLGGVSGGGSAVLRYIQNTTVSNTTNTTDICLTDTKSLTATLGGAHNNPTVVWSIQGGTATGSILGTTYTPTTIGDVTIRATVGNCFSDVTFNVLNSSLPTFAAIADICSGDVLAALPTTSTNGITGSWSPALDNTATTTYTFTPDAGQCASTTTLDITVNSNITPTFAAVADICSGDVLAALPTTSTNGITGAWSPALDNTTVGTTTYTFTPDAGQCAGTTTLDITVNSNTTPTFAAVADICSGDVLAALPTTSTNGITGAWSPLLDNTATTTYTFTPDAGQCATTTTLTINVQSLLDFVTLQFPLTASICEGETLDIYGQVYEPGLTEPNSQAAGITAEYGVFTTDTDPSTWPAGAWTAAAYNPLSIVNPNNDEYTAALSGLSAGTYYYAFRFSLNGCAFQYGGASVSGGGFWDGITNVNGALVVNPSITPTFAAVADICSGDVLAALPTTSTNAITGAWSPALDNTTVGTTTYTFTPDAGQCAGTTTLDITVNSNITPTFAAVADICSGDVLGALPATSTNGITGAWSPALDNTTVGTTTYTFTPDAGQCAVTTTLDITVNSNTTPTFGAVAAICSGDALAALPTTSTNGITGTWSPALDNTATTTYTFTPDAGQCATTTTLTITVNGGAVVPTFTQVADICSGEALAALPTTSNNGIIGVWSPALDNTATTTYTFTPNVGQCASTTTMTINVNGVTVIPTFDPVADACAGSVIPALPAASTNSITGTWSPAIDNTATTTYTFTPDAGQCGSTTTLTINILPNTVSVSSDLPGGICPGASVPANLTATGSATYTWSPATGLSATTGDIVSANPLVTTTYTVTGTDGVCTDTEVITVNVLPAPVIGVNSNPVSSTICAGGSIVLTGTGGITYFWFPVNLAAPSINVSPGSTTTYTVFGAAANGCVGTTTKTVTVNPLVTPTFTQVAPICNGATLSALPTTSNNGVTGTWSPAINNTATTTYTFTPTPGQCGLTATMTIVVNPILVSTFDPVAPICSGAVLAPLPTTSLSGVTGTWSPAINNTATTTYTFTPAAGQCGTSPTLTITVIPNVTPLFTAVAPICDGDPLADLPTTSNNGITGTWDVPVDNTTTTTYTFTPDAGICATTQTMTIVVNPIVTPDFTQVPPICSGGTFSLPTTSTNGITGTWSPVIDNTTTTTYTFTPDAGQCALTATMEVTVDPNVLPTFDPVAPICSGDVLGALPTTSTNAINGTWSPAINNAATTTYTFTPAAGVCATTTTLTIVVNSPVTPTFAPIGTICSGGAFTLQGTSLNGITGTWSPVANNLATTTYTFTPDLGQCATTTTLTVTISPVLTPTFTAVAPICAGAALSALPTTSNNGVLGSWLPALDNTTTTTYTFTPDLGQCANTETLTITVNPILTPTFNPVAPICSGAVLGALPTTSINGVIGTWAPAINNTATTTYTFTPSAGACAVTTTMTIVVNPNVTPTFNPIGTICSGAAFTLPGTSLNGITGTWSPVANNLATTTYTFTPTIGQCATTTTMTVTVSPILTPTFTAVAPICAGAALSPLPTTSNNGVLGSWLPALDNTTTTTYTFTPDAGQCANTATMTITVNPILTPTFNAVAPICSGAVLGALPTTSINGVIGTWAPAINNTATTSYTFTPSAGACAVTSTMTIVVNPNVTPTFNPIGTICSGSAFTLPGTSLNSITGTWSPVANNLVTTTYTFTPTIGQCATTTTMTVTVSPILTPTFTAVAPICAGAALSPLPTTSNNGVLGSWLPALNNTATTTYTFTPDAGQCANTATMTITVNPILTPTFNAVAPICSGATLSALPTTSTNSIVGTWSPAINNTATTTYTFTPSAGACATTTTMTITVNPNVTPTFTPIGTICSGATFTLPGTSLNSITGTWSPVANNLVTTTYTFAPSIGQCATTTTMTVTVSPILTPTFTAVAPICAGAALSPLPTTSNNGVLGSWLPALNNTATTTYTFTPSAGQCANTATMTITVNPILTPTFTAVAPICSGATLSPLPTTSLNGVTGTWSPALDNTTTTTYTFTPNVGQCANTTTLTIVVNPNATTTFTQIAPICSGATLAALPTTSTNGIVGSWLPALNNTVTTTYTFTPNVTSCGTTATMTIAVNPTITSTFTQIAPICSGATLTLPASSNEGVTGTWSPAPNNLLTTTYTFTPTAGQCATTATMTVVVSPSLTTSFAPVSAICSGATVSPLPTTSLNGVTGTWTPATINNTSSTSYLFTPNAGQCATIAVLTINVQPNVVPSFSPISPVCEGGSVSLSPIDLNGIFGSWSPAVNNTATTTYIFTPLASQCATTTTLTVTITPNVTPTFTAVGPICSGSTGNSLPLSSNEGINGTWSPSAVNNTVTTTYVFAPSAAQCANGTTMTIVVNPNITPTFTQVAPICSGAALAALLPISNEGISGTWSPAVNNTATTTYTFTPAAGQCATTTTMTIVVNPNITPTFTPVSTICFGASMILPTTSLNGITGTWNPSVVNSTSSTSYLFTPDAGQCATVAFMGISVVPNAIPTFNPIAPICSGASLTLPTVSTNGITGTWSPAADNTATTTYTFTPDAGQCAVTTTMTVTVNPNLTPLFTAVSPICAGGTLAPLQNPSDNGITGTWTPALNNIATTTYTFTPDAGICATTQTLTITVNPIVNPTFAAVGSICNGATLSALPLISNEGINGTWSPALNSTATTTYTFTPNVGECAVPTTMTIVVNPILTPTFTTTTTICAASSYSLPLVSDEGISGTWSPAFDNTTSATYTFTPDAGQCGTVTTLAITVTPNVTPTFAAVAPICAGTTLSPLPLISNEGINGTWSPALDNTATTTYTFTPNTGVCALPVTLTIVVNPNVTPTFAAVGPICTGSVLSPLPTTSNEGITGTWAPALDNTTTTTYTFTPDAGQCALTTTLTITVNQLTVPTFTAVAPICAGSTLSALPSISLNGISGGWSPALNNAATTTYTFTPIVGQCADVATMTITVNPIVTPTFTTTTTICSGAAFTLPAISDEGIPGTWSPIFSNTTSGTYTFTPAAGQCAVTTTLSITVNPNVTPTFVAVAPICAGATLNPLPLISQEGITGTWSPVLNNTATTIYTFTPSVGQCALTTTMTIVVNPIVTPTFTAVGPICFGDPISALPTTSQEGITGSWSPVLDNTTTTTYTFTPDATQCAVSSTMTIVVNPKPVITVTPTVDEICSGEATIITMTTSPVGASIDWTVVENGTTGALNGSGNTLNQTLSATAQVDGIATYTITPSLNGCAGIPVDVIVTVHPTADASFTVSNYCDGVGSAPVITGTAGGTFSFTPVPSDGATIDPATGLISNGVLGTTYIIQYAVSGICPAATQQAVSFNAVPVSPNTGNDTSYCTNAIFVSMTASSNNGGNLNWFDDAALTNNISSGTNAVPSNIIGVSTYYVTETVNGCQSLPSTVDVTVYDLPTAPILSSDATYCKGDSLQKVFATGTSGGTFNWYDDASLTNLIGSTDSILPNNVLGVSTYYATETSPQGCVSLASSVSVTINDCFVLEVPTAFTPDGDGVNDSWVISELSIRYPNNNVTIFNRWGQVLYNSDGYLIPWDGRFDNKDLPVGSYYYIIDFNDALDTPNATGIVTIIRN